MAEKTEDKGCFFLGKTAVPYTVHRNPRRKRTISLSVSPGEGLRILAPVRTGFGQIQSLVARQSRWILRRVEDILVKSSSRRAFVPGEIIPYLGQDYILTVHSDPALKQGCHFEGNSLCVNLPGAALTAREQAEAIRLELLLWYKKQARTIFEERTQYWCQIMNVRIHRLTVSNPKRLWGSCSSRNDVRLNWRLILAPASLLDYVIVHELGHIIHKNHSPKFWSFVEKFLPDYRERRRALRHLGPSLYAAWIHGDIGGV